MSFVQIPPHGEDLHINAVKLNERGDYKRSMASFGLQMLGVALSFVGFLGSIITCALPMWKSTLYSIDILSTARVIWEGLWMMCVSQGTGHMQCTVYYNSVFALPVDFLAARALLIISILLSVVGLLLAVVGGECTTCIEDKTARAALVMSAGVFFIIAGLLCLTPVCWSAYTIVYNPSLTDAARFGPSLYTGWCSAGLLLTGGALLLFQLPKHERAFVAKNPAPKSSDSEKEIE